MLSAEVELVEFYEITENLPLVGFSVDVALYDPAVTRCRDMAQRWLTGRGIEARMDTVQRQAVVDGTRVAQVGVEWQVQVGRAVGIIDRPSAIDGLTWTWSARWYDWAGRFAQMVRERPGVRIPRPKAPVSAFDADAVHDSVGGTDEFDPGGTGLGPAWGQVTQTPTLHPGWSPETSPLEHRM